MSSTIERKLAAIMFTDIVGYTSQMSKDQDVALSMLDIKHKALKPLIQKYNGTLVKEMGDGTLSHFSSSIDAANCSTELQKSLNRYTDLNIRIGIHHGETIFKNNDVFGDVVNIASRLETMAPPGGVLVSENVFDCIQNKKKYEGISLGLQTLKGIGKLVNVYALKNKYLKTPKNEYKNTMINVHSDKETPSIAIIPFNNKGTKKDDFYAFGISADLITDVSSSGFIRVSTLKDASDYSSLPLIDISQKLSVRYICTGTLWKSGKDFQLSVELFDSKTLRIIWSDRWEENWENLSSIKNNLTDGLLKMFNKKPKVQTMIETDNMEAYELYLKANYNYNKRKNEEDIAFARVLINKAIEIDNNLVIAKNLLALTYFNSGDYNISLDLYTKNLALATKIDNKPQMSNAINGIGNIYYYKGNYKKALDYYTKSYAIAEIIGNKRSISVSLNNIGIIYEEKGDVDRALDYFNDSLSIKEQLGNKGSMTYTLGNIGGIYDDKGNFEKCLTYYLKVLDLIKELKDKHREGTVFSNIGLIYQKLGDYDKALKYYKFSEDIGAQFNDKFLKCYTYSNLSIIFYIKGQYKESIQYSLKSISLQDKIGLNNAALYLNTKIYLYSSYKKINKNFDNNEIKKMIHEANEIDYELNYNIYCLLEDKDYLEKAYLQIYKIRKNLNTTLEDKFCDCPIPKLITEEYNKVFNT